MVEGQDVSSGVRIARNVLSNWGSYAFSMVVNFFLAPFVVHHLGNSQYGVWTLIVSLTGYLGLLDFGVRGAVTRYVARFHTQVDHERASRVASSALAVFTATGILAIMVSAILAILFGSSFHIPAEYRTASQIVLILAGFNIATSLVNGVFGGIIVGLQRFDLSNALEVAVAGLRAISVVVALGAGKGLITLACIHLIFGLARGAGNAWLSFRLYPELRIRWALADKGHLRLIFSFSFYSFLLHVSASLIYYTDNVVIGAFLPVGMITFYAIGANLVEYSRALIGGVSQTMSPLASSFEARQNEEGLRKLLLMSSRFATMAALPVALTFMLRGSSFIGLWMGPQYASISGRVLLILAVVMLFWPANTSAASILLGISKHRPMVPALLLEGLGNLALSILWIRSIGILGVALGTAVPNLVSSLIFWPWYIHRTLKIHPLEYFVSSWLRPGIAILPFAFLTYALDQLWPAPNLLIFFAQVAMALPLALMSYSFLCISRDQRQAYRRQLIGFARRLFS